MYFEIPVNMVRPQELVSLLSIFTACISVTRCGSFVTVTEDEAVQLEFPYSCDSNKVTIQSAHRDPFYNSEEPESLILPVYQLRRFSVTDGHCSVQVQINPVRRGDEATYISKAYKDDVIQGRFTKITLNVHYPPGDVACTFSINDDDAGGDWVPLQCTAPVGSLAGGIYCYQDSEQLPPQSKLVQIGETLTQTIWANKEHPVFCCSSTLDRPKDICECNDFVWDPSDTEVNLNPCSVTTAGQGVFTKDPAERSRYLLITDTVNLSTSKTYTNNVKSSPLISVNISALVILIFVTTLFMVKLLYCFIKKTMTISSPEKKEEHPETNILMIKMQECESESSPHSSKTQTKLEEERIDGGTSVP